MAPNESIDREFAIKIELKIFDMMISDKFSTFNSRLQMKILMELFLHLLLQTDLGCLPDQDNVFLLGRKL